MRTQPASGICSFGPAAGTRRYHPAEAAAARSGEWLAPLTGAGVVLLGILPAVPGVGQYGSPLGFFFYDLRWWWLAVTIAWAVWRADRLLGWLIERCVRAITICSAAARLLLFDSTLFLTLIVWAIVTSPNVRFSGDLSGDEPKYLRFCEVWYQGGGFAISGKSLFVDQPLRLC